MITLKHVMLLLEWYDCRIHRGVAQVAREAGWQLNCPKDPVTNEGIQASDVARAVGVSQEGLQKAFAAYHSTRAPGQEIRHQRSRAVAHLLSCTDAKLKDIAKGCGYSSVDTMINSFRSQCGTTPGKYRKQKREDLRTIRRIMLQNGSELD